MKYAWVARGRKIVCVTNAWEHFVQEATPEKGAVYTIRDVILSEHGIPHVRLEELRNPVLHYEDGSAECAYTIEGFKPLTDIRVFEKMLKKELVPA